MDNGLPQNSVKDIIKDKYGFIWLSTENGIVKYDGERLEKYTDFPTKNLNFEYFRGSIAENNIYIFSDSESRPITIKNRNPAVSSSQNNPQIITAHQSTLYGNLNKNIYFNGLPSYFGNYILKFKNSKYYFSTSTCYYQGRKNFTIKLPADFNNLKDFPNTFADNETIFIINKRKKKIIRLYQGAISENNDFPSIFYDKDTKIYWQQTTNQTFLINRKKIYRVIHKKNKLEVNFLTEYETFDKDQIIALFYDEEYKKLYLGSSTKGMNILSLHHFFNSKNHSEYADNVYYASLPFGKNSVITEEGNVHDKNGIIEKKKIEKNPYKRVLTYDNNFNIIYSKDSMILTYFRSYDYKKYDSIIVGNPIKTVKSFDNKILVTNYKDENTSFFCIYKENGEKEFELKMNSKVTPAFIEKLDPAFYLLSDGDYMYWFSIHKKAITLTLKLNIGLKQIQKIQDDTYLLTTFKNGLYILKNKKLIKLPLDPEKNLSTAHISLEDSKGNFWISSNNGLFRIPKKHILEFIEKRRQNLFYYHYTKEDGLTNNEFNGSSFPCANILENGEFVFPSMEGFVFFNPDDIKSIYPSPKHLFLERARIEGKIVNFNTKIVLDRDYKNAEILVDIPYYGNLENINLEYTIDDNKEWKRINNKTINIAGLSHGTHEITVRMLVSAKDNFTYKKIIVEVEPQFYETIWFRVLSVCILLITILFIVHSRTRFLKSKNTVLKKTVIKKAKELDESLKNLQENQRLLSNQSEYEKKIIENIIHDITTPVRFIALISQQLNDSTDPGTQKEYFESLHASSEQLHKYTLNLKDYTQIHKEDTYYEDEYYSLSELANEKRLLFNEIALHNNTIISNEIESCITINIKKSFMNMILHNLIDNAVKNTFDGYIKIYGCYNSAQHIIVHIEDTGIGMQDTDIEYYKNLFNMNGKITDSKFKSSLGLYLVSQVSKKINMDIQFSKNVPEGMIVKLILKQKNSNE